MGMRRLLWNGGQNCNNYHQTQTTKMRRLPLLMLFGLISSAFLFTHFLPHLPKTVLSAERVIAQRTWQAPMPLPTAVVQSGRRMPLLMPTTGTDDRSSTVELKGQVTMST